MTRADLIEKIAVRLNIPLKEAKTTVEAIFYGMVRALRDGDHIEIRGFGTFSSRTRRERKGRNPLTGMELKVPSKRVAVFKASAELQALVNDFNQRNRKERA